MKGSIVNKSTSLMSLLGVVLGSIAANGTISKSTTELLHSADGNWTGRSLNTPAMNGDAAANLTADLIQRGLVTPDPNTGRLFINGSIVSILKEYQLLKDVEMGQMAEAAAACGGDRCGCN